MPKVHTHLRQIAAPSFDSIERALFGMAEYPGTDDGGWLLGTLDEVRDLMAQARRSDLVVRFRDGGFDEITTAWRWLGDGVGIAYMIVGGNVGQLHLMLSGAESEDRTVARTFLRLASVVPDTAMPTTPGPALITVEREGYADAAGGYLLGMILIAPFCECCGDAPDPA